MFLFWIVLVHNFLPSSFDLNLVWITPWGIAGLKRTLILLLFRVFPGATEMIIGEAVEPLGDFDRTSSIKYLLNNYRAICTFDLPLTSRFAGILILHIQVDIHFVCGWGQGPVRLLGKARLLGGNLCVGRALQLRKDAAAYRMELYSL